jgi:hypothetical protein
MATMATMTTATATVANATVATATSITTAIATTKQQQGFVCCFSVLRGHQQQQGQSTFNVMHWKGRKHPGVGAARDDDSRHTK